MYVSERLQHVEYANSSTHLYLRANCDASMKKEVRFPCIAIKLNGRIEFGKCSCPAGIDQRCTHIACLLYLAEDIALNQEPKIARPCTSQPQAWGKGSKKETQPGRVAEKNYSKKRDQGRYLSFDPRPDNAPPPDTDR